MFQLSLLCIILYIIIQLLYSCNTFKSSKTEMIHRMNINTIFTTKVLELLETATRKPSVSSFIIVGHLFSTLIQV